MTTFAIVIPNLNQSHFLVSALESLKVQSSVFYLAVMDGGSTDNFREVVDRYSNIITYIRSAPDEGQAAAIREGKIKIKGDIVAWLNADDYYFPNALDKVASCFEHDSELDVVYGDAVHVNPEGLFLSYFPPIREFDAKELTRNNFICQPACFVRRSAYEKIGGVDSKLHYTMDWDLWCRLSKNGAKFHYLQELLAAVRYYPETKTLSRDKRRYREIYEIRKKYGGRSFRISFIAVLYSFFGDLYNNLIFKEKKTFAEQTFLNFFNILQNLKKKFDKIIYPNDPSNSLLYGFRRWDSTVGGSCTINIPWYDKRVWRRIRLKIEPAGGKYQAKINGNLCDSIFSENGHLVIDVPKMRDPRLQLSIRNMQNQRWRLVEFKGDFKNAG